MTVAFTMALTHEAVSAALPEREALVWRDRRLTHADLTERSRRLATYLHGRGLGAHSERNTLAGHESGQDHVAILLTNCNEYVETMLAAYKSRTVPVNVNYRYVGDEMRYLFGNCAPRALVYHARFVPTIAEVRDSLPADVVLIQVADETGNDLLDGAEDYDAALAGSKPDLPPVAHSGDDLHVIYTGGTTGLPKAVLWRQHDIFMAGMGGQMPGMWNPVASYDELVERATAGPGMRMLNLPPFMHGAAQWAGFTVLHAGGTILLTTDTSRLDAADALSLAEREKANFMTIIGDAMARPLADELTRKTYDLSTMFLIGSGSVALTAPVKQQLLALLPHIMITDGVGSSETGAQATTLSSKDNVSSGTFKAGPGACIVTEDFTGLIPAGDDRIGWLAQTGTVPLGYLGEAEKTAKTFPVIGGVRYSIPGDRARWAADGSIELLGRDSVTINSGGEKIFAEEVEAAISSHPSVADVTVCGRPSERWGSEVVAVVELADGAELDESALTKHAAESLARYKLPKAWIVVRRIQRSPVGKADYKWAQQLAKNAMR